MQEYLEEYLKREGLYDIIAEHRRPSVFALPIAPIWLLVLWIPAVSILVRHRGFSGFVVGVLGPPLLLAATLIVLAGLYAARQLRSGKKPGGADTGVIGGVFMFGMPILLSALVGFSLRSWSIAVWYALLSIVGMLLLVLLHQQAYRVHLLVELTRSTTMALWRSLGVALLLVPVLLVVVLLSVFSPGLWAALGGVSGPRLLCGASLLVAPALVLVLASLRREALRITGQLPDDQSIVDGARSTPFLRSKLDDGLISQEQWQRLTRELIWRDKSKLAEGVLLPVQNKVRRWLALLLALTSLALLGVFSLYFFVLFNALLRPALVASWTDIPLETIPVPLGLLGYATTVLLSTTALATAKVSLLLAVFLTVMSSVYALTDESFKARFTEWLRRKAASWVAVGCLYRCGSSPNYQIWEYVVRDTRGGIVNASIVVPQGASDKVAQQACAHMQSTVGQYRFINITAYEQNAEDPRYRPGIPGRRWRLMRTRPDQPASFEPIHLEVDEPRYQHQLAKVYSEEGQSPPDEWLGKTPRGIQIARRIWDLDDARDIVMHPYVFDAERHIGVEVSLYRRMEPAEQYRAYLRQLLGIAQQACPPPPIVDIQLSFRDTGHQLASVFWSAELPYVQYRDETSPETSVESRRKWEA